MHDIRPEFEIIAWILVLFVFVVVIYYMIILGWDLVYLLNSFDFGWGSDPASFFVNNVGGSSNLSNLTTMIIPTLICTLVLCVIFLLVSARGVDDGIGKLSNILIPMLFGIMIFIFVFSFTLPGSYLGVKTLLTPNWSLIFNTNI